MAKRPPITAKVDPEFYSGLKELCGKIERDFGIKKYSPRTATRDIFIPIMNSIQITVEKERNKKKQIRISVRTKDE